MELQPIKKKIVLYIDKYETSQVVTIKKGYLGTLYLAVTLRVNQCMYNIPEGTTAKIRMLKPDKKEVLNPAKEIVNDEIIFEITDQMQAAVGQGKFEVILFNGGTTITTSTSNFVVLPNVHNDSGIESTDEWLTVLNTLAELEEKIQEANEVIVDANDITEKLVTETLLIYKPNVPNYAAIATTYPTPAKGWTTVANDTNIRWRYNGTTWVNIGTVQSVGIATKVTPGTVTGNGNVEVKTDGDMWANQYKDKATIADTTFAHFTTADNGLAEVFTNGKTLAVLANPALPLDPSNPQTLTPFNASGTAKARATGENVLKSDAVNSSMAGVTYTVNSDGSILASGTRTGTSYIKILGDLSGTTTVFTFIKGITYRVFNYNTAYRTKNGNFGNIGVGTAYTPTDNVECVAVYMEITASTTLPRTLYPMLTTNSVASSYSQYKSNEAPITFSGYDLPNGVKDTVDFITGKKTQLIKKNVVSGGAITITDLGDNVRFGVQLDTYATSGTTPIILQSISSHFKSVSILPVAHGTFLVQQHQDWNGVRASICLAKTYLTTSDLTGINAWLSANPVTVVWGFVTPSRPPIITNITDRLFVQTYASETNISIIDPVQTTFTAVAKSELWSRDYLQDLGLQTLRDAKLDANKVANNDLTTEAGYTWDARRGKAIRDDLNTISASKLNIGNDYTPNLLINPDFQVWQRGTSFVGLTTMYSSDRWALSVDPLNTYTVSKNSYGNFVFNQTVYAGTYANIQQALELDLYEKIKGKTVTITVKLRNASLIEKLGFRAYPDGGIVFKTSSVESNIYTATTTIPICSTTCTKFILFLQKLSVGILEIEYIKLELNGHATPHIPRAYGEELALCQRYYKIINVQGNNTTQTNAIPIFREHNMRSTPTAVRYAAGINGTIGHIDRFGFGSIAKSLAFTIDTASVQYALVASNDLITNSTYSMILYLDAEIN
jgi:hypothetical protein